MNRRSMITAGAVVPITGMIVPGKAPARHAQRTPILDLFEEWRVEREAGHGVSEADCADAIDRALEIADQMAEMPATCMQDLAAKLTAWTFDGDFGLPDRPHPIWSEIDGMLERNNL